jgi:siroheme synthase
MAVGQLDTICEQLLKGGMKRTTKVAVIENGTTERQRSVSGTLATIAGVTRAAEIRPPAVVIIGSVAGLGDRLAWFLQK